MYTKNTVKGKQRESGQKIQSRIQTVTHFIVFNLKKKIPFPCMMMMMMYNKLTKNRHFDVSNIKWK